MVRTLSDVFKVGERPHGFATGLCWPRTHRYCGGLDARAVGSMHLPVASFHKLRTIPIVGMFRCFVNWILAFQPRPHWRLEIGELELDFDPAQSNPRFPISNLQYRTLQFEIFCPPTSPLSKTRASENDVIYQPPVLATYYRQQTWALHQRLPRGDI